LDPVAVPQKPKEVEPPTGIAALKEAGVTVSRLPLTAEVPFQRLFSVD
jgi:hypothetical protein